MGKVFEFQNKQEEVCDCPYCELISTFTDYILGAQSELEVEELVGDLVGLAREFGMRDVLHANIDANLRTLDQLDDEECDCDICDEENCDLED